MKNLTNGVKVAPETIVEALNNVDATLGHIHGLAQIRGEDYKGNLAEGTTVEMHLSALDDAIGNRSNYTNTANGEGKSNGYVASAGADVATALTEIASNIGTAKDLESASFNGVSAGNTVNANIAAINNTIGDFSQLKSVAFAQGDNMVDVVKNIDNKLVNLDDRMSAAERGLSDVRSELRRGMASLSAMSALVPNPRSMGNTSLSVGTGAYEGHTAVAFGGFHYITDNLMLNAGFSWGDSSDTAYRMGVTYSF